jgi:hypothetical protein
MAAQVSSSQNRPPGTGAIAATILSPPENLLVKFTGPSVLLSVGFRG